MVVQGRTRSARPPPSFLSLSFSPSCSLWSSQPLQSCDLSLSFSLSSSGGHGPHFAVGTTRATGHEPRATRAYPINIQHATTRYRHLLSLPFSFSFSPSLSVSRFCAFSLSFSLFLAPAYTYDAYDQARSRHGRWQRVRGT